MGLWRRWSTASWKKRARWALRLVTPWGIEWWLYTRPQRRALREFQSEVVSQAPPPDTRGERAIAFLVDRGLDEHSVREGSIPESSLEYIAGLVADRLPSDRPVRALHVGNFLGVSLCHLSWLVRERHPESVVLSVDPNITHRGIENPQSHVFALLGHFGLLDANLIVQGYTLEQTSHGEGVQTAADYRAQLAGQNVLAGLGSLGAPPFDLVLLDGNHEETYLAREFTALRRLLAEGSIVVFDDVGEWEGVVRVFANAARDQSFVNLGDDGRVGVLQLRAPRSR